jgi:hypothetical protein
MLPVQGKLFYQDEQTMRSIQQWAIYLVCMTAISALPLTVYAQAGGFGGGAGGGLGGGGFFGGAGGQEGRLGAPSTEPEKPETGLQPLVRVISRTIAPDTWDEVGGPGSIEAVDAWGMIVVSQTEDVHEQIEALVETLSRGLSAQGLPSLLDGSKEPPPVSLAVESRTKLRNRQRIEAALGTETTLDVNETPLRDVADFIADLHKIPVYINIRALEEVGQGGDTPVTVNLHDVSLRSALQIMLKELGLQYAIKDEVLQITTPEEAENHLHTRVYLVKDLIVPGHSE